MKNYARRILWLTVISSTLLIGSKTVDAKTALIQRQGDHVQVSYRYGDNYSLEMADPPRRSDYQIRQLRFYYLPVNSPYGFRGNAYSYYPGYWYSAYYR